ncbi:MAG: caspase family protein [Nostoc sp.]|uniref:caspase family protein n=1 Tax=Nostoc sp. TaxID=1180 RepID=UPI002FF5E138
MISRRYFLQFASSTLTTLGLNYLDVINQGNRYAQVLAQNTPRKLALLVGINRYPTNGRFSNLQGCKTDVDLQRELLIHRFGFNNSDILSLTSDEPANKQPTRSNILTAFEEHLIKQAKPTDVIVFHFSGHGSRLPDPSPIQNCQNQQFNDKYNSTFVVPDAPQNDYVPDIMGRTLFLLMSALKTENVTVVLDSCHSGGGTRGNFIIRSVSGENLKPSHEEIAYQERWMKQLQLSAEELAKRRCQGVAKGVVIAAAQRDEEAADVLFDGFFAGAFTYTLTQYLWQETSNVSEAIAQIIPLVKKLYGHVPLADGNQNQPVYFVNKNVPPTDAVIINGQGEQATLWLGGIEAQNLQAFGEGATFTIVNQTGHSGKVKLRSRSGLTAQAQLIEKGTIDSLIPGMLLQELSRVVPADLKLSIGLDLSLGKETNTAKAAISAINRTEAVSVQPGKTLYPQEVQYIFSQMTADYKQKMQQHKQVNLPAVGSFGLFTSGLEPVAQSFGKGKETVTAAITRLEPKIKSLVAAYIVRKTLNTNSSDLDVEVVMNLVDEPNKIIAKTSTRQGRNNQRVSQELYSHKIFVSQLFQFQVTNHSLETFYLTALLVDSTGDLMVLFPYQWNAPEESMKLEPEKPKLIGNPQELKLKAIDKGTGEAIVIVSRKPLHKAVKILQFIAAELNNQGEQPLQLNRSQTKSPLDFISDFLNDVRSDGFSSPIEEATPTRHFANANAKGERGGSTQTVEVYTTDVATLSISFEVGV